MVRIPFRICLVFLGLLKSFANLIARFMLALAVFSATISLDLKALFHALSVAHTSLVIQGFSFAHVVIFLTILTSFIHFSMYAHTQTLYTATCPFLPILDYGNLLVCHPNVSSPWTLFFIWPWDSSLVAVVSLTTLNLNFLSAFRYAHWLTLIYKALRL